MTLLEMVTILRTDILDDKGGTGIDWTQDSAKYVLRWENEQLTRYLNEAQKEAARRSKMFLDSTYSIKLKEGKNTYDRDSKILQVRAASLASNNNEVLVNKSIMDVQKFPDWDITTGTVSWLVSDYKADQFYVFRTPSSEDTLNLIVWRYPLEDLNWAFNTVDIEFTDEYAYPLIYYAASLAYDLDETNTRDIEKSTYFLAKFDAEFGPKESTYSEKMKGRRFPREASYGGIPILSDKPYSRRASRYGKDSYY